jgi:hypothetical protein
MYTVILQEPAIVECQKCLVPFAYVFDNLVKLIGSFSTSQMVGVLVVKESNQDSSGSIQIITKLNSPEFFDKIGDNISNYVDFVWNYGMINSLVQRHCTQRNWMFHVQLNGQPFVHSLLRIQAVVMISSSSTEPTSLFFEHLTA